MRTKRRIIILAVILAVLALSVTVYAAIRTATVPGTPSSPNENTSNPDDATKYITKSENSYGGYLYSWKTGEVPASVANPEQTINGYYYKYGKYYNGSSWVAMDATDPNYGWGCRVASTSSASYSDPLGFLDGYPVTRFDNCYRGCTALTATPQLPHTALIVDNAFYGCTALVTAELDGVSVLGKNMFTNCSSLQKVFIAESVTSCAATSSSTSPFYNAKSGCKVFVQRASAPSAFGSYYTGAAAYSFNATTAYGDYIYAEPRS